MIQKLIARITRRAPDFIIGTEADPYLRRWWVIPRNRFFNVYLHHFLRDDDDRAHHDHPWFWCSIVLRGEYCEHTIAQGGIHRRTWRKAGSIKVSSPWRAHRVSLAPGWPEPVVPGTGHNVEFPRFPCWTLFVTGPRMREWGFHCPERGWVPWYEFTKPGSPGEVGPGCDP